MAVDALSIFLTSETKDKLATKVAGVMENLQTEALSQRLKSTNLSGDPDAGTVEIKRFKNISSEEYGTARTAGKGQKLYASPVYINIDVDRELVEEIENKDLKMYGVDDLLSRRATALQKALERELDRRFFDYAVTAGTEYTPTASDIEDIVDEMVSEINTLSNDFIDGVDDEDVVIVADPATYKSLRKYIDTIAASGTNAKNGRIEIFHSVQIEKSNRLPSGVKLIVMIKNIIGQPVLVTGVDIEKVPLSNAVDTELFYSTKEGTATPEGIIYYAP